jgi:hypothetical protein
VPDLTPYESTVAALSDEGLAGELRHLVPECGPLPRGSWLDRAVVREEMRRRGLDYDRLFDEAKARRAAWHRANGPGAG